MPRVLLVGNFLSATGAPRGVCEELAERLRANGWSVIASSDRPGKIARLADMLSTVWSRRRDYDVAHVDVYSGAAFLWAEAVTAALRSAGKPYALTLHGGGLGRFAREWPRRVRRLLASAAVVTAPSAFLATELGSYRNDIRQIPNAIDLGRYPFRLRDNPAPRLVWLRAFHRIYDPVLAVNVVAAVRRRRPDATLDMFGPDKHDGSYEKTRAAAAGLPVAFHGAVPKTEIAAAINRGDIFLNTATIDNTPVTVLEAMACGAAIVSSDVGGIPHLARHNEDALLTPPGDAAAMAAAVVRILDETGLSARLSRNARSKAETAAWSAVLPQWEALFTGLSMSARVVPANVSRKQEEPAG